MLRELDDDIWEILARCLLSHWTDEDTMWPKPLVTIVKKKNGKLTMRGFRTIAMLPTIYRCIDALQRRYNLNTRACFKKKLVNHKSVGCGAT